MSDIAMRSQSLSRSTKMFESQLCTLPMLLILLTAGPFETFVCPCLPDACSPAKLARLPCEIVPAKRPTFVSCTSPPFTICSITFSMLCVPNSASSCAFEALSRIPCAPCLVTWSIINRCTGGELSEAEPHLCVQKTWNPFTTCDIGMDLSFFQSRIA